MPDIQDYKIHMSKYSIRTLGSYLTSTGTPLHTLCSNDVDIYESDDWNEVRNMLNELRAKE